MLTLSCSFDNNYALSSYSERGDHFLVQKYEWPSLYFVIHTNGHATYPLISFTAHLDFQQMF